MRSLIITLALAVLVLFLPSLSPADEIFVPLDYPSIQNAIAAAQDGDEIIVSPGTYSSIAFLSKAIAVRSVEGPLTTIIDAAGSGPVVDMDNEGLGSMLLEGFTITNGMSSSGAAIDIEGTNITVAECIVRDNTASGSSGGPVSISAINVAIRDCQFFDNQATGGDGGAIRAVGDSILIERNIFTSNSATDDGGAILLETARARLESNVFMGNSALGDGGAVAVDEVSAGLLVGNLIAENNASVGGGIRLGDRSKVTLVANTIVGNTATGAGGGLAADSNCHFTCVNGIFWGNTGGTSDEIFSTSGLTFVRFSNIAGGWPGEGNLDTDPLFLGPSDYRLQTCSPLINQGLAEVYTLPPLDLDQNPRVRAFIPDLGAFEAPSPVDDCNCNGVPDACDIASGRSSDVDGNGVPDECDEDCNTNGNPDSCDIASGVSGDCNENDIPDECDIASGFSLDDDLDGVPDECQPLQVPADYPTIQDAIDAARHTQAIEVDPGIYLENLDFRGKNVRLIAPEGPLVTIIDGSNATLGTFYRSVVNMDDGEGLGASVHGFSIRNGGTDTVTSLGGAVYGRYSDPLIEANIVQDNIEGPAIGLWDGSGTVRGNTIQDNSGAFWAGGVLTSGSTGVLIQGNEILTNSGRVGGVACHFSTFTISGNTISDNSGVFDGGGICIASGSEGVVESNTISGNSAMSIAHGGGIGVANSTVEIVGNTIVNNSALSGGDGGGVYAFDAIISVVDNDISGNTTDSGNGGGIYCSGGSILIRGNTVSMNSADEDGGGIGMQETDATVQHNVVEGNHADEDGGGVFLMLGSCEIAHTTVRLNTADAGAGVLAQAAPLVIFNCTLALNEALETGGGVRVVNGVADIAHSTIVGNSVGYGVSGVDASGSSLVGSIVWGNEAAPPVVQVSAVVSYCDVEGGFPGPGNINADPLFVAGGEGNYYLSHAAAGQMVDSPCIDAGSEPAVNLGLDYFTTRTDEVSDQGTVDLGRHYSFDDCDENGVADQYQPDTDGDGVIDPCDVCPGFDDLEDCNGNGTPDGCDILDRASEDTNGNGTPDECEVNFIRGDANDDGRFDISDPIQVLELLFLSGTTSCELSSDFDDNDLIDLVDAIAALDALFGLGPPPGAPFTDCGVDPSSGTLTCEEFATCL